MMNVETILSLAPDLVLVANWSDAGPVQQLREAGVPVYLMASGLDVSSIEEKITRLALLTGEPGRGRQMIGAMEARLAAVAQRVSTAAAGEAASGHRLRHLGLRPGTGQLLGRDAGQGRPRGRRRRSCRG